METLSPEVRKRVESLKEIQGEHDELEAKFLKEREELEAKYQKLYEPLYTKRSEIVNGVVEVDGVTTTSLEQDKTNEGKGVPDFWLTALKANEILVEEISQRDEEALKYLKDIKWSRIDNSKGFKLDFLFDTNPFFKNLLLTKTYHMADEKEPMLEKAIGTQIEWYSGKCLTEKILKNKPKKGAKDAKPIIKTEKCESFFNFFSPPEVPEDEDDIDEDEAEELQNLMEQDYDIGWTIRDRIIPHAVSWFTGEAVEDDELDMIDDNDDEGGEDADADADEEDNKEEVKSTKKKSVVVRVKESQQGRVGEGQQGRGLDGLGQQWRVGEGQQGRLGLGQQGRVGEGQQGRVEEGELGGVGESTQGGHTPECKQQ